MFFAKRKKEKLFVFWYLKNSNLGKSGKSVQRTPIYPLTQIHLFWTSGHMCTLSMYIHIFWTIGKSAADITPLIISAFIPKNKGSLLHNPAQ